jgi:hypothetical protein
MKDDERRIYKRQEIDLGVRFISREDLETTGRVIDISEGGLAMKTDAAADMGDTIIAYPEGLGRLTGKVVRKFEGGIAIQFDLSDTQRTYLKKRIESAVSGGTYIRLLENRVHKRVAVNLASEARLLDTGEKFTCRIIDISESGAGVSSSERPAVGMRIQIGSLKGRVCRHTEEGFAIEFAKAGKAESDQHPSDATNARPAARRA